MKNNNFFQKQELKKNKILQEENINNTDGFFL